MIFGPVLLFLGDAICFYISLLISLLIRQGWHIGGVFSDLVGPFSFIFLLWAVFLFVFGFYDLFTKPLRRYFRKYFVHFSLIALLVGIAFFYLQPALKVAPRMVLFLTLFIFLILVMLERSVVASKIKFSSFSPEELTKRIDIDSLNEERAKDIAKSGSSTYVFFKRTFDLLFGAIGFVIFAVTFPFVAIFIKISSKGPIFFVQKRKGKDGKIFNYYKYRSMFYSPEKEENNLWREKDSAEVTLVGRFLRYTHLDEIPQILNVLKGDLSFIGPRAEWERLAELYEKEIPFYSLRYAVKPGFTGWAQILYRPSTSVEEAKEKFSYDLYYIKHRSFWFDVAIFLRSWRKIFG